jgi:hypothetical protein
MGRTDSHPLTVAAFARLSTARAGASDLDAAKSLPEPLHPPYIRNGISDPSALVKVRTINSKFYDLTGRI